MRAFFTDILIIDNLFPSVLSHSMVSSHIYKFIDLFPSVLSHSMVLLCSRTKIHGSLLMQYSFPWNSNYLMDVLHFLYLYLCTITLQYTFIDTDHILMCRMHYNLRYHISRIWSVLTFEVVYSILDCPLRNRKRYHRIKSFHSRHIATLDSSSLFFLLANSFFLIAAQDIEHWTYCSSREHKKRTMV